MGEAMQAAVMRSSKAGRVLASGLGRRMQSTAAGEPSGLDMLLKADYSKPMMNIFHKSNIACMALFPFALALPDSFVYTSMVFNTAVGLAFPLHGHIGFSGMLTDYVPKVNKSLLGPSRAALLGITTVTTLGLLKLNLTGDGITKST